MNLSQFPSGSHLAKSAQHHVLTNILAYHNTAMQVLDQTWLISILLEAQTEGFGFICNFFNLDMLLGANHGDCSLRRMTRQWFERLLII